MKKDTTTKHFELNPKQPPKTDWSQFDAMSDEDRHAAAASDPDCPPSTEEQLARAYRLPDIKAIRRRLNMTQQEFARQFHLSLGAVRDWEQGSHQPDHAARTLLKVIAFSPEIV